jgi:predicted small secreted protein
MNVKPLLRKFYERANRSLTTPQVWANEIKLKTLPLFDPHKTFTHRPKIAFVKQEVTPGFYCTSLSPKPLELLETCFKHSGPLGLSTIFDADFPIVKTTSDPETQVWKECVTDAKHGSLQDYEMLRTKPF